MVAVRPMEVDVLVALIMLRPVRRSGQKLAAGNPRLVRQPRFPKPLETLETPQTTSVVEIPFRHQARPLTCQPSPS